MDSEKAIGAVVGLTDLTRNQINALTKRVFICRGGRIGSGMGTLLEGLWGFYMNHQLRASPRVKGRIEIGWLVGHEYNDFACVRTGEKWDPATRSGELFRIEVKSMNLEAKESKGHFDQLKGKIGPDDQLLVILWHWESLPGDSFFPRIVDQFLGNAIELADARDALHIARGGSFVSRRSCPDRCSPPDCSHDGEPLNARGKRERKSGPVACRESADTSHAQNFGGLVRMLKTESSQARNTFRSLRRKSEGFHRYVSFIHRNLPNEEAAQYVLEDWIKVAQALGLEFRGLSKTALIEKVRKASPDYHEKIRRLN